MTLVWHFIVLHVSVIYNVPIDFFDYFHQNVGGCNFLIGWDPFLYHFFVGNVALDKCKVCYYTPICVVVCNACIVYMHSTTLGMYRIYIHLGVHDHPMSNGTCCESKKNLAIVMVVSNFFSGRLPFKSFITRWGPSHSKGIIRNHYGQVHNINIA